MYLIIKSYYIIIIFTKYLIFKKLIELFDYQCEVQELIGNLQRSECELIDPNPLLALGVSNVICGITMSLRFSHGDARFARLNHLIEEGMRLFGEIHYGEYIPLYNVSNTCKFFYKITNSLI